MSRKVIDMSKSLVESNSFRSVTRFRWVILIAACLMLLMSVRFSRSYVLALFGNGEAMYYLSCEYERDGSIYVRRNLYKSDYWVRKSASRGNIRAIIAIKNQWEISNGKEVVYWLRRGVEFGHPWCAEQLAWGYRCGMYGLPMDPVLEAKYRAIAADLEKKNGK